MEILKLKILALFVLFAVTVLFGLLPYALLRQSNASKSTRRRSKWREITLSFCSCFAGGVFLGTCLLSLIPEIRNILAELSNHYGIDSDYPNAELLVGVGFFCILVVEQTILTYRATKIDENAPNGSRTTTTTTTTTTRIDVRQLAPRLPPVSGESAASIESDDDDDGDDDDENNRLSSRRQRRKRRRQSPKNSKKINLGGHAPARQSFNLRALVLLVALSVHSLFEGMALGLQEDARLVLQILYALLIHKSALAFSLGSSLALSGMRVGRVVASCVGFGLMSPAGIGIGIGVMETSSYYTGHLVSGLMQGLAAGTFLYVTVFEIMAPEFNVGKDGNRLWKVLGMGLLLGEQDRGHGVHSLGSVYFSRLCFYCVS